MKYEIYNPTDRRDPQVIVTWDGIVTKAPFGWQWAIGLRIGVFLKWITERNWRWEVSQ